jgi:hypothetical protein
VQVLGHLRRIDPDFSKLTKKLDYALQQYLMPHMDAIRKWSDAPVSSLTQPAAADSIDAAPAFDVAASSQRARRSSSLRADSTPVAAPSVPAAAESSSIIDKINKELDESSEDSDGMLACGVPLLYWLLHGSIRCCADSCCSWRSRG